jgi:hypothetical protein
MMSQFRRDPCGSATARWQEKIDKTINPLIADGDRRCQHQGGTIHPFYYFETKDCLARSRRGYQMQAVVLQVAVKVIQQARLIDAPGLSERHYVRERFPLRVGECQRHELMNYMFAGGPRLLVTLHRCTVTQEPAADAAKAKSRGSETEGNATAGTFEGGAGAVLAGKTPLGRLGRVTDIAPLAVFLASDESAWITGEVIRAAGGLVVVT